MPDFDVCLLIEFRNCKSRSHGIRKKGNNKRKRPKIWKHGRNAMLSFLRSLSVAVLRILDTKVNRF